MTIPRFAAICAAMLFFCACNQRQTSNDKYKPLSEAVDKEVWRICDSFSKNYIYSKDSAGAHTVLLGKLKQFPWKDSVTHAWLLLNISEIYGYNGGMESLGQYCEQALAYFENHPEYPLALNMCYSGIGFSMVHGHGNIYKANYYSTKAAALCLMPGADTLFPPGLILRCLTSAANSNRTAHLDQQALRFSREVYRRSSTTKDTWPEAYMSSLLGMVQCYVKMEALDSALLFLKRAEAWNDSLRSEDYKMVIGYSWATYYLNTKQYDSSLYYSRELAPKDAGEHAFGYLSNEALLYCLLNRKEEAKQSLDRATALYDSIESDAEKKSFISVQTLYKIKYGDRKDAAQSFFDYDNIISKYYDEEHSQMALSIESEYNVADKQKHLDRLSRLNEGAKRQIQAKNNLLIITGLVLLLCTVLIVALLLLSRQRKLKAATQAAEAQRDKIALEQRLLRTQMEPHFIFNTMAAMQHFIARNENEKAGVYLNRFSRLLRSSLEHSREDYVLVAEEIEALENYISLQAMQSEDSFEYTIQAYDGYQDDDIKIPPMLLQPFVENAVLHGVSPVTYKGYISINIEKKENVLDCTISDNGSGMGYQGGKSGKSLATQITKERLEALSRETGVEAKLELIDRATQGAQGTIVYMIIPFV